ncbi:XtrA/YqaO family protein [Bacillus velezensis]|uniref:XtrA/YqaO family protein n=1 Tax=Bacillus velezensis TaxID=492670 RepID=UPI003AFA5F49
MAPLPTYGETKIIINHGKVTRVKWDEGELFNWIQVQDGKPVGAEEEIAWK